LGQDRSKGRGKRMGAVTAQQLTKTYNGKTNALESVTFDVPEGGAFALLGGRDSGKSTLVRLLSGLLHPSRGTCSILQLDPFKQPEKVHRLCGVLLPSAKMYQTMTGQENLHFFGRAAGMRMDDLQTRSTELMKDLGIWEARGELVQTYSTSMRQRLSLARALLLRPRVLLLDEPDDGLDPEGTTAVFALLRGLRREEGVTLFVCTRQPRVAQRLCERFALLHSGRLTAMGSLSELSQAAGCVSRARFHLALEDSLPGWQDKGRGYWEKEIQNPAQMPQLLREVIEAGHAVYEARLLRPSLEDAYVRLEEKEAGQ